MTSIASHWTRSKKKYEIKIVMMVVSSGILGTGQYGDTHSDVFIYSKTAVNFVIPQLPHFRATVLLKTRLSNVGVRGET